MKIIAIDWSGVTVNARNHIWLAESDTPGHLLRLECGRDRHDIANYLTHSDASVIGFDFAFSFPLWFLDTLGIRSGPDLWQHVAAYGESWLSACEPPFWGRPGHARPTTGTNGFRRTELAVPKTAGIAPKSIFQIGGAGAVGTGSIRGMPILHELHLAGARVWPFTDGSYPVVVEIYPRLLTGAVNKSNPLSRKQLLARRFPSLGGGLAGLAAKSEDAFDALVSALVMSEHADDLLDLPVERDPELRAEGRIWHPRWRDDVLSIS